MASKQYSIFQIQGGLGKHIAATAVAQAIKNNHPDRDLIVVCAWPELWVNLPFVHRVYPLGGTQYFYEEYVQDKDSLIFAQEPYFTTTHVHKQLPLVQSWCKMYGIEYNGEKPTLRINPEQRRAIRDFYAPKFEKPVLLMHTNGGLFNNERAYSWARDMPLDVAEKVAQHFKKSHSIFQVCRTSAPKLESADFVRNDPLSNTELVGLLELTDKRLLIDSSLQHAAAAFGLPSTVLWNATSSVIFGHDLHDNIQAKPKPCKPLPSSYLFDYQFDGNENEFPYEEGDLKDLFDIDRVIASIEKQ